MEKFDLSTIAAVLMSNLGDVDRVVEILEEIKYATDSDRESGAYLVELLEKKEAEEEDKFRKEKEEMLKSTSDSNDLEIISIHEPAACDECWNVVETKKAIWLDGTIICPDCGVEDGLITFDNYDDLI